MALGKDIPLTDREHEVFTSRFVEELTQAQTAERLQVSTRRVRVITASVRRRFYSQGIPLRQLDRSHRHTRQTPASGIGREGINLDRIDAA